MMNRRSFFTGGLSILALSRMAHALADSQFFHGEVPRGPFLPFWESLKSYRCPDWFQDAKFGIWEHWSPQCVSEQDLQIRQRHWAIVDLVGKGGHVRTVPVPAWVKQAIDRWRDLAKVAAGRVFRAEPPWDTVG